jgi:hypothetical protein
MLVRLEVIDFASASLQAELGVEQSLPWSE